jgi:hypothetical protein
MFRLPHALLLVGALAGAPLQCGSEPEPALRRYETPDEALYELSERFKQRGDRNAWQATLEYLVERYPNSRFAARARQELSEPEDSP